MRWSGSLILVFCLFSAPVLFGQPFRMMTDMEVLIDAIIWVESRGNCAAVGDGGNAVGCLQIWPVYVHDVNRILGEDRYSLDDRRSGKRSIEMFDILQRHYNPAGNIDKAIRLHNKGRKYYNEVKTKYNELKQNYGSVSGRPDDTLRRTYRFEQVWR